jgi:hypothetical protein
MKIKFPEYSDTRCLMMPYLQGNIDSVPTEYHHYADIINSVYLTKGDIGFLTIDESVNQAGKPHRGDRSKTNRALHTEAGKMNNQAVWGVWKGNPDVKLDPNVRVLLANNIDDTCAIWNAEHINTSLDGDIGYAAHLYPYKDAVFMKNGEVHEIGIFTPHESIPIKKSVKRQFLRIVSSGVHGREPYFTHNPLMN